MVTFWISNLLSNPETRKAVSKKVREHLLNKSNERKHGLFLALLFSDNEII